MRGRQRRRVSQRERQRDRERQRETERQGAVDAEQSERERDEPIPAAHRRRLSRVAKQVACLATLTESD